MSQDGFQKNHYSLTIVAKLSILDVFVTRCLWTYSIILSCLTQTSKWEIPLKLLLAQSKIMVWSFSAKDSWSTKRFSKLWVMTFLISGTCGRGHWLSLFYEAVKNFLLGNVGFKWTLINFFLFHSCFSMAFGSKLKINLYHEYFLDTLEKYTRFPKFTLLFSISYVRINGKPICMKWN